MYKPINLMQVTHDLAIGGLQQVVVNICRTINRDMFHVVVLCLRGLGEFVPEIENLGIKVILLPQKDNGTDYLSFLKVARVFQKEKIEVIHTHNTQPFIDGTIGALLSGVKRIVHTDHGRIFPDKKRNMYAERVASIFCYKVVGVSLKTASDLMKYERIPSKKVLTISNGVDGSKFNISIDKEHKKTELGIKNKGPIIGLASRLSEEKGVKYLLSAMLKIINNYPDCCLIIAGNGPLKNELQDNTIKLGITKNVVFIGPRIDMPELFNLFDLIALPSISEGMPMVLLEAMAAACPIVATEVGGVPAIIQHGHNGSLVKPGDPDALVSAILRVLGDKELRARYSYHGLEIFNDKYSAEIMTRKYEQLYLGNVS